MMWAIAIKEAWGLVKSIPSAVWIGIAVLAAVFVVYSHGYKQGRVEIVQQIKDESNEAEKKALGARLSVAECYASGGTWDRHHGVCAK